MERHTADAERLFFEGKYPEEQFSPVIESMRAVGDQQPLALRGDRAAAIRRLPLGAGQQAAVFIRIDPPPGSGVGSSFSFDVTQQDS